MFKTKMWICPVRIQIFIEFSIKRFSVLSSLVFQFSALLFNFLLFYSFLLFPFVEIRQTRVYVRVLPGLKFCVRTRKI